MSEIRGQKSDSAISFSHSFLPCFLMSISLLLIERGHMDWDDFEEIAEQLSMQHPEVKDPYSVRFTELMKWIVGLDGFEGDKNPVTSMEGKMENIVQAWAEYI